MATVTTLPAFKININNELECTTADLKKVDNAKFVATILAVGNAAALQLLSGYASKVALWTKSEEAKLARLAERDKIMSTLRNVFSEGKYVLLEQRDTNDTGPGSKRLKIMRTDETTMADIGECQDSLMQYYEVAAGRLVCNNADNAVITSALDFGLIESAQTTANALSQYRTRGLIDDPYDHEYQLRHYLLNMSQFVTQHMQGSTLQDTENLLRQIELTDMHASHTISLLSKRQRDTKYVMTKALQTLFEETNHVAANEKSLYVIKPRHCDPMRMEACVDNNDAKLDGQPDAKCTCTSVTNYTTRYAVFENRAHTFFAAFSPTQQKWKTIGSTEHTGLCFLSRISVTNNRRITATKNANLTAGNIQDFFQNGDRVGIVFFLDDDAIFFGVPRTEVIQNVQWTNVGFPNNNAIILELPAGLSDLTIGLIDYTYPILNPLNEPIHAALFRYNDLDCTANPALQTLNVHFWEMPSLFPVNIDELTDDNEERTLTVISQGIPLHLNQYPYSYLHKTQGAGLKVTKDLLCGRVRRLNPFFVANHDKYNRWLSSILRPALASSTLHAVPKPTFFEKDCVQQTVAFAQGQPWVPTNPAIPNFGDNLLEGYELIPVAQEDVPLYSTAMHVPIIEFQYQAVPTLQWFVGGMPTLALDGLMAASLYTKTIAE